MTTFLVLVPIASCDCCSVGTVTVIWKLPLSGVLFRTANWNFGQLQCHTRSKTPSKSELRHATTKNTSMLPHKGSDFRLHTPASYSQVFNCFNLLSKMFSISISSSLSFNENETFDLLDDLKREGGAAAWRAGADS